MGMRFIADEPPGICSQEDLEHDFRKLIAMARFLGDLAKAKGYKIPPDMLSFGFNSSEGGEKLG